jgi:hypothetical protein
MVNGAIFVPTHPHDFGLEIGNPPIELRHRQWIEILSGKLRQRIIAAAREILFGIHVSER